MAADFRSPSVPPPWQDQTVRMLVPVPVWVSRTPFGPLQSARLFRRFALQCGRCAARVARQTAFHQAGVLDRTQYRVPPVPQRDGTA